MSIKKVLCFLSFCLSLTIGSAQGWDRLFPLGDYNAGATGDMIPTPDGGFLINSRVQSNPPPFTTVYNKGYFHRVSANGTQLWKKTHEEVLEATVVAMWPVGNNLLFVTLQNDTTRFIKTDANLHPVWSQVLDAPAHMGHKTRIRVVSGGYVVMYQQNDAQSEPVRIIKTNPNGEVLWQEDLSFASNFVFREFVADEPGNLYVFGDGGTPFGAFMGKVSPAGDLLFTHGYPNSPESISPVVVNSNTLAFLDFGNKLIILDANGQQVNALDVPVNSYRMAATSDGNLLLVEQGSSNVLHKISSAGTNLWTRTMSNVNAAFDKAPFAVWSLSNGGYAVFFEPSDGTSPYYMVRTDANGLVYTNRLYGHVFADLNGNCLDEPSDLPASRIVVTAQKNSTTYYALTDSAGNYDMTLDTGSYLVKVKPPNVLWGSCTDSFPAVFNAYDTLQWNNGITSTAGCPWPSIDMGTPVLRRCAAHDYTINYANEGNVTADSAIVEVTFDPFLIFNSATRPYTSLGNNTYRFYIGPLVPLQRGSFQVSVTVSCNAELGQTHCSSAAIHISNECPPLALSKPVIVVNASCVADSVAFKIKNIGAAPMTQAAEFVIIEDLIVMRQGQFQLPAQQETVVTYPTTGATSRMYAGQAPGESPFFSPTAAIEGCNGPIQPGYWNMFPESLTSQETVRDCRQNVGSYDPNDKQAVPTGYGTEHYIGQGVGLDYTIRFQNTGTDTAFTVTLRDTLSKWLDPASVRPGASSHPYSWQLLGTNVLEFRFDPIRLPDSTTNLAGSQGFVSFRVEQKPNVPLQTLILNQAGIFFDLNAPVLTNTTSHRVGDKFLVVVDAWEPNLAAVELRASPNPFNTETVIELRGLTGGSRIYLEVFDMQGRIVQEMTSENGAFHLQKGDLKAGMYGFRVRQDGGLVGRGKVVVME